MRGSGPASMPVPGAKRAFASPYKGAPQGGRGRGAPQDATQGLAAHLFHHAPHERRGHCGLCEIHMLNINDVHIYVHHNRRLTYTNMQLPMRDAHTRNEGGCRSSRTLPRFCGDAISGSVFSKVSFKNKSKKCLQMTKSITMFSKYSKRFGTVPGRDASPATHDKQQKTTQATFIALQTESSLAALNTSQGSGASRGPTKRRFNPFS